MTLLVLLAARAGAAQTEVRVVGDKVHLRATGATISEVLDRLGRQTDMTVMYDGAPPRGRINLDRVGLTQPQAVLSVLEGQGLNYALRMDRSGTRVEQLLLVASTGAASAPAPPPRPEGPRLFQREPEPPEPEEDAAPAEAPPPEENPRRPPFLPGIPPPSGPAMPLMLPTPPPQVAPSPAPPGPAAPQDSRARSFQ
jgi:hypothetical protein